MQHPDEGMIHAWIDGALDAETVRDLETHLASCEECARMAAEARGLVAASSRILTALDNVPARVIPVAGGHAKPGPVIPRWRTPFWMRTAAAVVIVAGVSALVLTPKVNTPESKIDLASAPVAMEAVVVADSARITPRAVASDQGAIEGRDMSVSGAGATKQRLNRPSPVPRPSGDAFGTAGATVADARAAVAPAVPPPSVSQQSSAKESVASEESRRTPVAENALRRLEERLKRIERTDSVASSTLTQRRDSAAKLGDVSGILSGVQTSSGKAVVGSGQAAQDNAARKSAVSPSSGAVGAAAPSPLRAEVERDARVSTLPGCYALSLSPWSGGTIPFGAPPARIELDSLTSLEGPIRGLYLVHPGPGAASNKAPLAYWRVLGDSVHVTWRDDQRGVLLKLPVSGDVLTGTAHTLTMSAANQPAQTSTVEARRISCRE
jgi:hypothetical protein